MMMKSFDKAPTIRINGEIVKVWNNGEYGSIGMRDRNVEFKPYGYDEATQKPYEYIDDLHPNVVLATGFTAYQYAHPDDADSMQHYYDKCKEAYKATLRYKAYYNEKIFAAAHIKDEAGKADASKVLYEYVEDKELKELSSRYLHWLRQGDMEKLKEELLPFFPIPDDRIVVNAFVNEMLTTDRTSSQIAPIVLKYYNEGTLTDDTDRLKKPLWDILSGYDFPLGDTPNWRAALNKVFRK